jgi:beta-N-acetylhexosaminidase
MRFPVRLKTIFAALALAAMLPTAAQAATLAQMAGQMVLVGFKGTSVDDATVKTLIDEIRQGQIGGLMYLRANVKSLADVKAMNAAFLAANPKLPPFISLDQEGGKIERLTAKVGFPEMPSEQDIGKDDTPAEAGAIYARTGAALRANGFNLNFAPVVDLNINPDNPIIGHYGRSFGVDPDRVTALAAAAIAAYHKAGILTALKHFPGHGSSTADSHEGYVDITKSWSEAELQPYEKMFGDGYADLVMIGHLINRNYSDQPASLAPEWIDGVLRGKLGFSGVVISDDLEMGAIRQHYDLKETVTRAVRAGVDVLLFSNTVKPGSPLGDEVRAILVAEAEADPAFRARIEESYQRIVALKARIGG